MDEPLEVLQFMATNSDSDTRTHEVALRVLGRLTLGQPSYASVVSDGRFHSILSALAGRLDECDAQLLAMIADSSARFRTSTPELTDLAQRLAEVCARRADDFNPRCLTTVATALANRGVRDVATVQFIRTEAPSEQGF